MEAGQQEQGATLVLTEKLLMGEGGERFGSKRKTCIEKCMHKDGSMTEYFSENGKKGEYIYGVRDTVLTLSHVVETALSAILRQDTLELGISQQYWTA